MNFPPVLDYVVYRKKNPDLANLSDSDLSAHFAAYGQAEGRTSNNLSSRVDFAALVDSKLRALEIGPFANPVLKGKNVDYCDVLNQVELRERAKKLGLNPNGVPAIKHVTKGGDLDEINDDFSVVLTSHSIEHQPDLIHHLQQVERKLNKLGGRYFALIPDKRYCFDRFIAESTIAGVIDAHEESRRVHTLRSIIEHRALTTHNDPAKHWASAHSPVPAVDAGIVQRAVAEWNAAAGGYVDVHAWYFTPDTFVNIISLLNGLGYIRLVVERLYPTRKGSNEFWVILKVT